MVIDVAPLWTEERCYKKKQSATRLVEVGDQCVGKTIGVARGYEKLCATDKSLLPS